MAKILHIEDDPANRLLVRKLLPASEFDVLDAPDGLAGIRMARELRPDLILVDIAIPGLDGYEVTLRLRSEPSLRGVPIVAITAEGSRDTSLSVGCDGFLQKPIDARTFARTVRGYLHGHRESVPVAAGQHLREQSQKIVVHLEEKIAELSAANARLVEADQARREFYRNISHELATPMTPIVGYVKLLADEELGPLSAAQSKALRAMGDCVTRLRGLIENLLDVTGLETGRLRFNTALVDLGPVVQAAVDAYAARLQAGGRPIGVELPSQPLRSRVDAARVQRAVEHLLDNAVKFAASPAAVGVRLRRGSGGYVEICVADAGPGIDPDKLGRLFDPFYQVDGSPTRHHGGTGIGLAIVRGVAQGLGGDVRVVSPSDERIDGLHLSGAAFTMALPAGDEPV